MNKEQLLAKMIDQLRDLVQKETADDGPDGEMGEHIAIKFTFYRSGRDNAGAQYDLLTETSVQLSY